MCSENVPAWSRQDVCFFLERLGLEDLKLAFQKNAVDGADLVGLTDTDLIDSLGCTQLQARKIRSHLTQLGVTPPACAGSAADLTSAAASLGAEQGQRAAQHSAETDIPPSFQPADLQRYQQLTKAVAALEGLEASGIWAICSARLAILPAFPCHLFLQIARYSDQKFSFRGLLTTKKHKEVKLVESEARAEQLVPQVQACEAEIAARQSEVAEAQRQLEAWRGTVAELATTRQQLVEHVEGMFAAPAWRAYPRHAELKDALAALSAQEAEAARGVDVYGRGTALLRDAERLLRDAQQNLSTTQMLTMVEMATDAGPGGQGHNPGDLFGDFMELALVEQAESDVRSAARKVAEARTLLSGLPALDERVMGAAKIGVFQDFVFDGIASDVFELAMVSKSKSDVGRLQHQVAAAASWAQSNLSAYQQQDAALKAQAAAKKGELDAFRRAALEAALAAGI
ncbi:hypothetical protein ABPG77_010296 [Micractinium sp. CCAP 211/92]